MNLPEFTQFCSTYELTKQFMEICVKNCAIDLKKNNLYKSICRTYLLHALHELIFFTFVSSSQRIVHLKLVLNYREHTRFNPLRFWSQNFVSYFHQDSGLRTKKGLILDTLPPEMFGAFGSVWCKMALGEVEVSLPWQCHALVLLAPGYWRLFLNLIIFS